MTIFEAIILGIVQGITEFLPISSDGHLELGKAFLNIHDADNLLFTILVHGATVLSIIIVFRKDIGQLLSHLWGCKWNEQTQYLAKLFLSMIPVGIIGLFFEDQVAAFFNGNVQLVGMLLIINGIILLLSQIRISKQNDRQVSTLDAILIGIAQCFAVLPGISRSTCTISTALILGIEKTQAARFSLLMVIVPILGATALKLKDLLESTSSLQDHTTIMPYIVGFLAAFITGLFACSWLVQIVKRGKIAYFALYCFIVGALAIYLSSPSS